VDMTSRFAIERAQAALKIAAADAPRAEARDYLRGLIARTVARDKAHDYARERWGDDSRAAQIVKTGVSASDTSDMLTALNSARDSFFRAVVEASIIGRMDQARRVALNTRTITPSANARGYWVGESKPVPLSKVSLSGATLDSMKVAALVLATTESLADPAAEGRVVEDIMRAMVLALDEAFIDAGNGGNGSTPAAVTNGISAAPSSSNPATDIAALVAAFDGDLSAAILVTDPTTATSAALARDGAGNFMFPALGPRGGSAANIPVLTSRASPRDSDGGQWALIDQSAIAVGLEGAELSQSTASMVEADDDPSGDAEAPTAATSTRIALFQSELVAFKGTIHGNWQRVRSGAVSVVAGADYATDGS
jgi:hypothetical protein